ncbi:MAG: low molecular weight phosphotyrosine protein phosphatase [Flavobacteriales bacterium]|nr:low molecular weight phosphotyrosine protein phosphatase [Flavobacteriales bacterium]
MKILMVCLGNICRSPMAEGVLRHLAAVRGLELTIDSAGTSNYHVGDAPDRRARAAMKRKGMDIDSLRGRQVRVEDFHHFDRILAMDASNLADLRDLAPDKAAAAKVRLLLEHAPQLPWREVPDPYYGGEEGFDQVFDMLLTACNGLLDELARPH